MSTPTQIMADVASLMNDTARSLYTDVRVLPYLNMAWRELRTYCQQHNYTISNATNTQLVLVAGVTGIGGPGELSLPSDLIEIQTLYERQDGTEDDFIQMQRCEFLPPTQVQTAWLTWYSFNGQRLQFIGATGDQQLKINYVADIFSTIDIAQVAVNLPLINSHSFLQYRTAALCSQFIGENESRAEVLNQTAQIAIDAFGAINTKSKQGIATRRRPFMMGYKSNNNLG